MEVVCQFLLNQVPGGICIFNNLPAEQIQPFQNSPGLRKALTNAPPDFVFKPIHQLILIQIRILLLKNALQTQGKTHDTISG